MMTIGAEGYSPDMTVESQPETQTGFVDVAMLRDSVEIIENVSRLIVLLKNRGEPDSSSYTFEYLPGKVKGLKLPGVVSKGFILKRIEVSVSAEKGGEGSLSIRIDGTNFSLFISRGKVDEELDHNPEDTYTYGRTGELGVIPAIADKEISDLLISLIRPGQVDSYKDLGFRRLLAPDVHEELIDTLGVSGETILTNSEYDNPGAGIDNLKFTMENNELKTFSISFQYGHPGQSVVMLLDCQHGVNIDFALDNEGFRKPFKPDEGTIKLMRERMINAVMSKSPSFASLSQVENARDQSLTPEEAVIAAEERQS